MASVGRILSACLLLLGVCGNVCRASDMILNNVQKRALSQSKPQNDAINYDVLWPNGVLYYVIERPGFEASDLQLIRDAMDEISKYTCLVFKERTGADYNYIKIQGHGDCSAMSGLYDGGDQYMNLGPPCRNMRTVQHEILHAAGFIHEHQQSNRDTYVKVFLDRIDKKELFSFVKAEPNTYWRAGVPYSWQSIMHYYAKSGDTNNDQVVIETVPAKYQTRLERQHYLSYTDVHVVNKVYQCAKHCTEDESKCTANGVSGHLDKNCNCVCEDGSQDCDSTKSVTIDTTCRNLYFYSWECYYRAIKGDCNTDASFMHQSCAKACNTCSTMRRVASGTWPTTGPCTSSDTIEEKYCQYLKDNGDCEDSKWIDFMRNRCSKTCDPRCQ